MLIFVICILMECMLDEVWLLWFWTYVCDMLLILGNSGGFGWFTQNSLVVSVRPKKNNYIFKSGNWK